MVAKIRTYGDLAAEKLRLQVLLAEQRLLIKKDVSDLKEEMRPIKSVLGFVGKLVSKDRKNPVLSAGVDLVGDVLLKNFLFAKSGFLTKWIAPYVIKNFSTAFLASNQSALVNSIGEKVKGLISKWTRKSG